MHTYIIVNTVCTYRSVVVSYNLSFNITPSQEGASRPFDVRVHQSQSPKQEPVKLYLTSNPYEEPIICKPAKNASEKVSLVKRAGKKVLNGIRKVRPGHIFAMAMMGMMCFVRFGGSASAPQQPQKSVSAAMANAYEQGAQHVRDSIRIAHLEQQNKLISDSLKQLKKLPK